MSRRRSADELQANAVKYVGLEPTGAAVLGRVTALADL